MNFIMVILISVGISTIINFILIQKTVEISTVEVRKIMKRYEQFIQKHLE